MFQVDERRLQATNQHRTNDYILFTATNPPHCWRQSSFRHQGVVRYRGMVAFLDMIHIRKQYFTKRWKMIVAEKNNIASRRLEVDRPVAEIPAGHCGDDISQWTVTIPVVSVEVPSMTLGRQGTRLKVMRSSLYFRSAVIAKNRRNVVSDGFGSHFSRTF